MSGWVWIVFEGIAISALVAGLVGLLRLVFVRGPQDSLKSRKRLYYPEF